MAARRNSFTFQSGSIQIDANNKQYGWYAVFTFQSGSIQIIPTYSSVRASVHFTFQSGSIQIGKFILSKPSFTLFTFQSGSIQILILPLAQIFLKNLYIPIWFYSNRSTA